MVPPVSDPPQFPSMPRPSVNPWRADFPVLDQEVNGRPLVYLDNAATTQKPRQVIEAISNYYLHDNSNVHRGIHTLSARATSGFEGAREKVARFLGAAGPQEIIFTRGTTEAINLVAQSWGRANLRPGDRILLTEMEHHSNIVPWQMLCERTGARLAYVPVTGPEGLLDLSDLDTLLGGGTKLFAFTHTSNTLGTVNPAADLCRRAREAGVVSLVDAAQSAGHRPVDVRGIGCDFLVFSGHKMCGPTGIGALYGRESILDAMPPWQGGGDMISRVDYDKSRWNTLPHKFEAGTPDIAGAIGLGAALDYLETVGRETIRDHDAMLAAAAWNVLREVGGLTLLGPEPGLHPGGRAGVVSFVMDGVHAHDVVTLTDRCGVALRGGHHCNQPLMKKLGYPATSRASFYFYNSVEEITALADAIGEVRAFFSGH